MSKDNSNLSKSNSLDHGLATSLIEMIIDSINNDREDKIDLTLIFLMTPNSLLQLSHVLCCSDNRCVIALKKMVSAMNNQSLQRDIVLEIRDKILIIANGLRELSKKFPEMESEVTKIRDEVGFIP